MQNDPNAQSRAEHLALAIRTLQPDIDRLANSFRMDASGVPLGIDQWSAQDWRRSIFGDALVRLRQLAESNFRFIGFIEPMGLLAVARYVFEMSVWLHLLKKDCEYGFVYYRELAKSQRQYYEDTVAHLHREVELLKRFEDADSSASMAASSNQRDGDRPDAVAEALKAARDRVDSEASRKFSMFLDEAKTNGYGFQAHLVETQLIPRAQKALDQIAEQQREFDLRIGNSLDKLSKGRWQWRQMAAEVGLSHEHDYIYSFASKLLHATPSSITTDQKNLEIHEVCMFLRYVHSKYLEILELARSQPECALRTLALQKKDF